MVIMQFLKVQALIKEAKHMLGIFKMDVAFISARSVGSDGPSLSLTFDHNICILQSEVQSVIYNVLF